MKNRTFILFLIASLVITLSACQAAGPAAGGTTGTTEPEATKPTEARLLTAEEAQAIALAHAGLTAGQVTFERTEYDVDDGVKEYEVDFRSDDWEYDYEIHAETGKILSSDKEFDPPAPTQVDPTVPQTPEGTEPVPTDPTVPVEPNPTEPEYITAEKAENIALSNAGLKRDDVRFERTEFDVDDGVAHYDVEFDYKGWEYDYEIHAVTGAVLSAPKETRPPDHEIIVTDPIPTEPAADKLTAADAEDIALKHAGLKRKNVRFEQTEYDVDDGVPEYEVEFYADGWEYSYEIHAETGKILSSEKDYDD